MTTVVVLFGLGFDVLCAVCSCHERRHILKSQEIEWPLLTYNLIRRYTEELSVLAPWAIINMKGLGM